MKMNFDIAVILAPLAEVTDFPFRRVVREFSPCLMFTEMVSAAGAYQNNQKTLDMMKLEQAKPLGVQLFGHDPYQMAEAAKIAEASGADIIDINMGCPVKKIVNDGNGSALMKNEKLAGEIVEAVVKAVSVPVSAKFRSGWTAEEINAPTFAKVLESAGASMLTVHGRTRSQFYSGKADYDVIKQVKENVRIPVIANGDICSGEDAVRVLKITGADGVMIGRAALGHPWILRQIYATLKGEKIPDAPSAEEQKQVLLRHLQYMIDYYGCPRAIYHFRKHICWYVSGMQGASVFRAKINTVQDEKILVDEINTFYDGVASVAEREKNGR